MFKGDLGAFYAELDRAFTAEKPVKGMILLQQHDMGEEVVPGEGFLLSILPQLVKHGVKSIFLEKTPEELDALIEFGKAVEVNPAIIHSSGASIFFAHRALNVAALAEASVARGISIMGVDKSIPPTTPFIERVKERDRYMQEQIISLSNGKPFIVLAGLLHHKAAGDVPKIIIWSSKDTNIHVKNTIKAFEVVSNYKAKRQEALSKEVCDDKPKDAETIEHIQGAVFVIDELNKLYPNQLVEFPTHRSSYYKMDRRAHLDNLFLSSYLKTGSLLGVAAVVCYQLYTRWKNHDDDSSPPGPSV